MIPAFSTWSDERRAVAVKSIRQNAILYPNFRTDDLDAASLLETLVNTINDTAIEPQSSSEARRAAPAAPAPL